MYGIDISKWQKGIDLKKAKYDFCIVKATEGIGYVDPVFLDYAVQLTEMNKLMGFYHYARPDFHFKMEEEAKFFINTLSKYDLIGKGILVLDWELSPFDNETMVKAWLEQVVDMTGIVPFIYGSRSKLTKWKDWSIMKDYPIWMAAWPNKNNYKSGEPSGLKEASHSPINWKIWQYSATGRCEGYNNDVDLDYTDMTEDEWKIHSGQLLEEVEKELLSDDMKWAIEVGLFKGREDGRYSPKDYLTREQAATLFRRYTKLFIV